MKCGVLGDGRQEILVYYGTPSRGKGYSILKVLGSRNTEADLAQGSASPSFLFSIVANQLPLGDPQAGEKAFFSPSIIPIQTIFRGMLSLNLAVTQPP